jgi:molybdopterin molybdotransferase
VRFDRIAILDWSAASRPRLGQDSIWLAVATEAGVSAENLATRAQAEARLGALVAETLKAGERMLIGVDFALGYPSGFAETLTGQRSALAIWDWLAGALTDGADNANDRFQTAARMNRACPGLGPFWFRPAALDLPDLPARGSDRHGHGLADLRLCDTRAHGAQSVWKLGGAGSVGSQSLTGQPMLSRLRAAHPGQVAAWPFQAPTAPVVLAEVFPSLLADHVAAAQAADPNQPRDAHQVRLLALALRGQADLSPLLSVPAPPGTLTEEGWILGLGHEAALRAALPPPNPSALIPPRLRDDCFAMPQGVDWIAVDTALARLRAALHPVTGTETLPTAQAGGRVLAEAPVALRPNPPAANSAVDGYGLSHATLIGTGPYTFPLVAGRAAAGQPLPGSVPPGQAVRILTGAILPDGVDTVILDEDCATDGARVAFDGPVKPRANTRRAGEDVDRGAPLLPTGRRLTAPDLALLSATAVATVSVHRRLRVAVLSTGDELAPLPRPDLPPHHTIDANRPMLLQILRRWGYDAVDLGHAADDPRAVARALDRGAKRADAILTSGGASAGDEDHVARLLAQRGQLASWRIALKPGRPLALALWRGVPVFGLPGNPVAALVCTLIFARPALSVLAGGDWAQPLAFTVPAAFSKSKKPGRREYLRARLTADGAAEVFRSEGSGRISGLSWAEGLVELPDSAADITPGTLVRYLPYAGFNLS